MNGALALQGDVVCVARETRGIEVATYDLDGARLGAGFTLHALGGGRARVGGIALDRDLRLYAADPAARAVRIVTLFGTEQAPLASRTAADVAGDVGEARAVSVHGVEDELRVLVGSRGDRRHGAQVFDRSGRHLASLRSRGDAEEPFPDVVHVSHDERFALVCDARTGLVQVFRDLQFHFGFRAPRPRGGREDVVPKAARRLSDGRFVVLVEGESASAVQLVSPNGVLMHTIAGPGSRPGEVQAPCDLVVREGANDRCTRVIALDQDGSRVQVLNLEGVCFGAFPDLSGADDPLALEST